MTDAMKKNATPLDHDAVAMGHVIRTRRKAMGLTLKQLAAEADLSHPFLSLVERGLARPSMVSFTNLTRALGSTPLGLIAAIEDRASKPETDHAHVEVERSSSPFSSYSDSSAKTLLNIPGTINVMEVRSTSEKNDTLLSHSDVDELWYVLSGHVGAVVGGETFSLSAGDALHIPRGTPHNWWTEDGETVRLTMTQFVLQDT